MSGLQAKCCPDFAEILLDETGCPFRPGNLRDFAAMAVFHKKGPGLTNQASVCQESVVV
jgi:hypothetical protein